MPAAQPPLGGVGRSGGSIHEYVTLVARLPDPAPFTG